VLISRVPLDAPPAALLPARCAPLAALRVPLAALRGSLAPLSGSLAALSGSLAALSGSLAALCVSLAALTGLAGCASPTDDDEEIAVTLPPTAPDTTQDAGDGSDDPPDSSGPTSSPIGLPADACRLIDPVTVARLAGARQAVGVSSAQGPFRTCEYRMTTESRAAASMFLDVTDQRTQQLYELATQGAQLSVLSAVGSRASLSPATGRVYALTSSTFFTLGLPTGFGSLANPDGLRTAAEQLASAVVARLGP
jgi:hypothetical protein